jgi:hypothetical protein
MKYFATLPKVVYTDKMGSSKVMTNIMARASLKNTLFDNPVIYYTYDIQDGDTPEIIAHKYYGDVYRYWIVLYVNQIMDPQWGWPVSSNAFDSYIADKYPSINVYNTPHHYEKVITQFDSGTNTTTTNTLVIDEYTYNNLPESTSSVTFPSGTVTINTTKRVVSLFDYELNLNESKRSIKILNSNYVNQFETELTDLMAA